MVFHPSYVRTSAVSYTFYFHSFQVSTTSFYSRGPPCRINSFFATIPPLAAQAHNCLSGSLLSRTSSQQHSIFRADASSSAHLSSSSRFPVQNVYFPPLCFCIWPRVEFYGASSLPAFYFRSRGHRVCCKNVLWLVLQSQRCLT